jgi:hypothetical protein
MKLLVRLFISGIATLVTYYFVLWLSVSLILPPGRFAWIATLVSPICAIAVAGITWWQTAPFSQGLVNCIVLGAVVTGGAGFSAGFFGPMIFDPGANQGPMLGIFITGPLGSLAGAAAGAIYWRVRGKPTADRAVL